MNKVKNALELALGVFREPYCDAPLDDVIKACEEALASLKQEQGEPVAWQYRDANDDGTWSAWNGCDKQLMESDWRKVRPLYTTPQQRTWLELTPEEVSDIAINNPPAVHDFYQAIADALKEKNNG